MGAVCGALPVPGGRLTSAYGMRGPHFHNGVDIAAREGTPVRSVLPGVVIFVAPSGRWERYGNTVVIDHGRALGFPLVSLSAHLSVVNVNRGDSVPMGAAIGHVGRTAGLRSDPGAMMAKSAAHLHLEFFEVKGTTWSLKSPRVDAGDVLRSLSIAAPAGGPMYSACGHAMPSSLPIMSTAQPPQPQPQPSPAAHAGHAVGGLAVVALLGWWWWSRREWWWKRD